MKDSKIGISKNEIELPISIIQSKQSARGLSVCYYASIGRYNLETPDCLATKKNK